MRSNLIVYVQELKEFVPEVFREMGRECVD